jgi:hypothetical protein
MAAHLIHGGTIMITKGNQCRKPPRGRRRRLLQHLRGLGPYVLIELIMPGGTILAFSLYLDRRWNGTPGEMAAQPGFELCAAALLLSLVAFGRFCGAKQAPRPVAAMRTPPSSL